MAKKHVTAALLFLLLFACPKTGRPCFTIIAGKKATADGSVLLGHNEDNSFSDVAGMKKVLPRAFSPGSVVKLPGGGTIPQVKRTFGFLILEMPGCDYSNALLNEHGVAVVSNNCPSREDKPELTDGGIGGPILRRLVAERAKTAREGVLLVGKLIQRFGYTASGRTLSICDREEGWMVAMVNGKHYVAARVPDTHVAVIANTYTIRSVDLSDKENFLGSPDLVTYAIKRGWHDPGKGPFSFEKAYAGPETRINKNNTLRRFSGMKRLAAEPLLPPDRARLPFTITPQKPLKVQDLTAVLRDHYEGTAYESFAASPHLQPVNTICNTGTNTSSIVQLRSGMPVEIGALWWCAFRQPCFSIYCPLYLGVTDVPDSLGFGPEDEQNGPPSFGPSYTAFTRLAIFLNAEHQQRIGPVHALFTKEEQKFFSFQKRFEKQLRSFWNEDPSLSKQALTDYCRNVALRCRKLAESCMETSGEKTGRD